jgi:hypothetical protein
MKFDIMPVTKRDNIDNDTGTRTNALPSARPPETEQAAEHQATANTKANKLKRTNGNRQRTKTQDGMSVASEKTLIIDNRAAGGIGASRDYDALNKLLQSPSQVLTHYFGGQCVRHGQARQISMHLSSNQTS